MEAMARLDLDEAEARTAAQTVEPSETLAWLNDLPALRAAAGNTGRRLLSEGGHQPVFCRNGAASSVRRLGSARERRQT